MAGKYKRIYLSAASTLLGLFLIMTLIGVQITSDGDVTCAGTLSDPCVSYLKIINPTAKSIYIYNYDEVKLDFSPEIERYELYVKYYGKWRYTNFTMETRLGNIPKDRKYVFVFPRYSIKEFKLVGYKKNPSDVIKWGMGVEGDYLDPVWYGVERNVTGLGLPLQRYKRVDVLNMTIIESTGFLSEFNITEFKSRLDDKEDMFYEFFNNVTNETEEVYNYTEFTWEVELEFEKHNVTGFNYSGLITDVPLGSYGTFNITEKVDGDNNTYLEGRAKYTIVDKGKGVVVLHGWHTVRANFTTGNVLQSNVVNDVFVYDITEDSVDYTTWFNATNGSGVLGRGASFDGTGDYVIVNQTSDFGGHTEWSGEGWFKYDASVANDVMLSLREAGGDYVFTMYRGGVDRLLCRVDTSGGIATADTNNGVWSLVEGQWYHQACTFNGTTIIYYIDGVNIVSGSRTGTLDSSAGMTFLLGGDISSPGLNDFGGDMDELYIYNRSLTPEEVNNSYQRGLQGLVSNNSDTDLLSYWNFEDDFSDQTANGNDGSPIEDTFIGFSWWWGGVNTAIDSSATFDGTADYITVADDDTLDFNEENMSFEFWFYPTTEVAGLIISKRVAAAFVGYHVAYDRNVDKAFNLIFDDTGASLLQCNTSEIDTVLPGSWYHVVFTHNEVTKEAIPYLNGVNGTPCDATAINDLRTTAVLTIGRQSGATSQPVDGNVDELKIYRRVLTPTEINTSYQRGLLHLASNNSDTNIELDMSFDNDASDASGNGNDGTFQGDARITGRSSTREFPLKSYLIATDLGLDIIDASDDSLWKRNVTGNYGQVFGSEGRIFLDNSTHFLNWSFIDDVYSGTESREDNYYFTNDFSYWSNSTGFCYNDTSLNFDFTCGNFTIHSDINDIVASSTEIFVANGSAVWIYNSTSFALRSGVNNYTNITFEGSSNNVTALALVDDNITLFVGTYGGSINQIITNSNTLWANWTSELLSLNVTSMSYSDILLVGLEQGANLLNISLDYNQPPTTNLTDTDFIQGQNITFNLSQYTADIDSSNFVWNVTNVENESNINCSISGEILTVQTFDNNPDFTYGTSNCTIQVIDDFTPPESSTQVVTYNSTFFDLWKVYFIDDPLFAPPDNATVNFSKPNGNLSFQIRNINVTYNSSSLSDTQSINITYPNGTSFVYNETLNNIFVNASNFIQVVNTAYKVTVINNNSDGLVSTFNYFIIEDNTAPEPTENSSFVNLSMVEDNEFEINITANFTDTWNDFWGVALNFSFMNNTNVSQVNCSVTNIGIVNVTPALNWNSGDDFHSPILGSCWLNVSDENNNTRVFEMTFNVSAVNDAPIVTMISPVNDSRTIGNLQTLTVSVWDDNATINVSFYANVTGSSTELQNWTTDTRTTENETVTYDYTTLDGIQYDWFVNASDYTFTAIGSTWTFLENNETAAPDLVSPTNNSVTTSGIVTWDWDAVTDSESDSIQYTVYVQNVTPPNDVAGTTSSTSLTPDSYDFDTYYWRVRTWDGYEYSPYSEIWILNITENTAPIIDYAANSVANDTWVNNATQLINLTVSDAQDNINTVILNLDNGSNIEITLSSGSAGTYNYWIYHTFTQGFTTYNVTVTDDLALQDITLNRLLKVDSFFPAVEFVPLTDNNTILSRNYTHINISFNDTNMSYVGINFNGTIYQNNSIPDSGNWFINITGLISGNYSWFIYGADISGQQNISIDYWTVIDVDAPVVILNVSRTELQWNVTNQTVNISVTDFSSYDINTTVYYPNGSLAYFNDTADNFVIPFTEFDVNGTYIINTTVVDAASLNTTVNRTFNVSYLIVTWNDPSADNITTVGGIGLFNWTLETTVWDTLQFIFNGTDYTVNVTNVGNLSFNWSIFGIVTGEYNYTLFINTTNIIYNVSRTLNIIDSPIQIDYCGNETTLWFDFNISLFDFTTLTLTQYNESARSQDTYGCVFNLSLYFLTPVNLSIAMEPGTGVEHNLWCARDNNISNRINVSTDWTFINNYSIGGNPQISCWWDWINASSGLDFNVTWNGTEVS